MTLQIPQLLLQMHCSRDYQLRLGTTPCYGVRGTSSAPSESGIA